MKALTTKKKGVVLREYRKKDRERLAELANNPAVANGLRDAFPRPYTKRDAKDWIRHCQRQDPIFDLAIEVEGMFVGGVGATELEDIFSGVLEFGYWVGKPYWNQGIASAAAKAYIKWLLKTYDHIHRIEAFTFSNNPASARVLEKAGLSFEGTMKNRVTKNGEVLDALMYSICRG